MPEPRNPAFRDVVETGFARQGLMTTFGAELAAIAPGAVAISAPITQAVSQQQGFAHAALTFALGDSAAGFSALSLMEAGFDVVTAEMKIQLLAPAIGTHLVAEGRVIRPGKRLMATASSVYAVSTEGNRTHVAELMGTMVPIKI